ncbi:MAG: hypothetical protein H6599_02425 [Flavobacteriales bacterium]|nr:hypothetical protein [Flavobacteriales bacterium]
MNSRTLLTSLLVFTFFINIVGQDYQTFTSEGFKVKCDCKLYVNSTYIQMAKKQNITNIKAAYVCAENEDNPEIGVINNININDESQSYRNLSQSEYSKFEKKFLSQYATNLMNAGINYKYITYQGVSAIEYTFDQQGIPTKSLIFLKNKKSYLLQVATRKNLTTKFSTIKSSFIII